MDALVVRQQMVPRWTVPPRDVLYAVLIRGSDDLEERRKEGCINLY